MQSPQQIIIQQLSFILPNGQSLFQDLTFSFSHLKTGLVGRNGIGKSTLMKLMAGELFPNKGSIQVIGHTMYIRQNPIIPSNVTIAEALGVEEKLSALQKISEGSLSEKDFEILNDDWTIKEKIEHQLAGFGLHALPLNQTLEKLSGGEFTRLFLIKAFLSDANILLLDEPTNHLDSDARQQLYDAISAWPHSLIVISHDRDLLNQMEQVVELSTLGLSAYGGNYEFYIEQKSVEQAASENALEDAKKLLLKTQNSIQFSREKHEQKQSYGKTLRRQGAIDKLSANSAKGRSERTQSTLLIRHERMLTQAKNQLQLAKEKVELTEVIHVDLPKTKVPNGKIILEIEDLVFSYPNSSTTLIQNFNLKIHGPERFAITGKNGSGKTTLIKLILNELTPLQGKIVIGTAYIRYLDQNTQLLNAEISILENFLRLNPDANENEAYQNLAIFLFKNTAALKPVKDLSGGEKLRALLACVLMSKHPPQLLILDEPTNHLDLQSIASIESALQHYQGAMMVISHDKTLLKNIGIERIIAL